MEARIRILSMSGRGGLDLMPGGGSGSEAPPGDTRDEEASMNFATPSERAGARDQEWEERAEEQLALACLCQGGKRLEHLMRAEQFFLNAKKGGKARALNGLIRRGNPPAAE
jgi:hypothetical protein